MAKVTVKTLTEHCWEKCPNFKIYVETLIGDGSVAYRIFKCENLTMCKHAVEEDKKWNNKSAEEK